jgi:hypothetical protein
MSRRIAGMPRYRMRAAQSARPPPWLPRLRYSIYLLGVVILGSEVLLRVFDPLGIWYLYEIHRYSKEMMVADHWFSYVHEPGIFDTVQGVGVSINSHGLRGPEFSPDKPAGTIRLMILGDSVVFGWGVEEAATFPRLLQADMDRSGIPVEIIAAGVGSWNTRTQYEWFRRLGVDLAPDMLLLLIVENDTDPKREGYTEVSSAELFPGKRDRSLFAEGFEDFWRFASRRSYVAAHLKYLWEQHLLAGRDELVDADSPQWRDARMALDGLIGLCRERGIELVVYLNGSDRRVRANNILTLYQDHLMARGIRPLTFPEALEQAELRNSAVDSHLNARGHEILAAAMLEILAPRLAAKRPEPASGDESH